MYIPSQWGVCAPSSCNADGVKIIADFNIGIFFSALNMDVTTKVAERSCHYEGDGKNDLTVGAWLFMYLFVSSHLKNRLFESIYFQNLYSAFNISFDRYHCG